MAAAQEDARAHPRARARVKVDYHFGDTTGEGHTVDVSEGGIFLAAENIAPVGTRVYLRIHLELEGTRYEEEPLKIIGVVARAAPGDDEGERSAVRGGGCTSSIK